MSRSRLQTVTSRSFLNQHIQYREVIHNRSGHSTVNSPHLSSLPKQTFPTKRETESRLEQILRQRSERTSRNITHSLSLDQAKPTHPTTHPDKHTLNQHYRKSIATKEINLQDYKDTIQEVPESNYEQPLKDQKYKAPPLIADRRLEQIDIRLEDLVTRKLKLVLEQTSHKKDLSQSVARVTSEHVNLELQTLLHEIRSLKHNGSNNDVTLLNNKIRFIETLLAEQITEAELMKKYYFTLNSKKKKGKIGDFNHLKHRVSSVYRDVKGQRKEKKSNLTDTVGRTKALFNDTTSRSAYKQPRPEDYESFRYKHKNVALNLQPLPRSSYKREFLYPPSSPDSKIINRDHSPYYPNHKSPLASIYQKDYRSIKTEAVNYRDLDAYKNKYKILRVDYMPKNRLETVHIDRSVYEKDVQMSSSRFKSPTGLQRLSDNEVSFNKHMLKSEAQRQFRAQSQPEPSRIKHQQLLDAQYRLKKLFKA